MKKAMISQPMRGKSHEEITMVREKAVAELRALGYEVVDSYFTGDNSLEIDTGKIVNKPLFYLAKSLECLSECTVMYFCKGWEDTRGCWLEHEAAKAYGLFCLYAE